jgi:hypothetical protein
MSAGPPVESRSTTLALLAAALLLMGLSAASQWTCEPVPGTRAPCQNTGHAPCR